MSRQTDRLRTAILNGAKIVPALLALFWLWSVRSSVFNSNPSEVADRVSRGESYDINTLRRLISEQKVGTYCDPKLQRNILLLQFRVATDVVQVAGSQSDSDISRLSESAKKLLSCSPTESIAWLALYWSEIHTSGFGPKALSFLNQSYAFAPHEEWIQFLRAPLVLRASTGFPDRIQQAAITDFEDIFRSQLYPSAAVVYKLAAEKVRPMLLDRTCHYPLNQRVVFLHFVSDQGLSIKHDCYQVDEGPEGSRS